MSHRDAGVERSLHDQLDRQSLATCSPSTILQISISASKLPATFSHSLLPIAKLLESPADMNFNIDDIWGEGEEHGKSPTRATHDPYPESAHDTKDDGSPPTPPNIKQEIPQRRDKGFPEAHTANWAPVASLTGIADGARRGWQLFCFIMLSRPVLFLLGFIVLLAFLWGALKALLFTFPALIANKAIFNFVDHISTSRWLTRNDPYRSLPSLSFRRPISDAESEILPQVLKECWSVLSETFPYESYNLRADFEQSRSRINTLESLTRQGIIDQIEARATRDYQQILALLDELHRVLDTSTSTNEYPWYSLRSAASYRMQEALRYQSRLKAIAEGAIEDTRWAEHTISEALAAAKVSEKSSREAGICRAEPHLHNLQRSSWKGSDLVAASVMICQAEDQAVKRWKQVSVTVGNVGSA